MAETMTFTLTAKDQLTSVLEGLSKTTEKFGSAAKESASTAKDAFSKVGSAIKSMGATAKKMAQSMYKGFRSAFKAVGSMAKTAFKAMSVGAAGATAAIAGMVKTAGSFDLAMREVWTLTDWGTDKFKQMSQSVIALSADVPDSASTMASALYSVISAGREGADMFHILDAAAKLGVAGLSSTDEALGLLVSMLNAFNMESKDAMKAADLLFTTIKAGQTKMEWLTQYAPALWPTAATLGIDPAEIQALFASLTLAMGEKLNPRAVTGLVGALNALYGMKISDKNPWKGFIEGIRQLPPLEALERIRDVVMEYPERQRLEVLTQIIPERRAAGAIAVLVNNWESLESVLGQFEQTAGQTEQGYGKASGNIITMSKILLTNIQNVAIQIGNIFVPAIKEMISWLNSFAKTMGTIDWKSIWDNVWGDPEQAIPEVKKLFNLVKTEFFSLSKELEGGGTMPTLIGDMIWSAVDLVSKVASIIWTPLATEGEILIDKLMRSAKAAFFEVVGSIIQWLAGSDIGKRLGITRRDAAKFARKAELGRMRLEARGKPIKEGGLGVYAGMRQEAQASMAQQMRDARDSAIEDWARIRDRGIEVFDEIGAHAKSIYGEAAPEPGEDEAAIEALSPMEAGPDERMKADLISVFDSMREADREAWRQAIASAQEQLGQPTAEGDQASQLMAQMLGISLPEDQQKTHTGVIQIGEKVIEIGDLVAQNQIVFQGRIASLQTELEAVQERLEIGDDEDSREGAVEQTSAKTWGFAM